MARRSDRRREMEKWLDRRERGGWTLRELARRSGIPVGTISWWSHELRKQGRGEDTRSGFCAVVAREEEAGESRVPAAVPAIRIRLPDGTELDLDSGVDESDLARVLAVLESRC